MCVCVCVCVCVCAHGQTNTVLGLHYHGKPSTSHDKNEINEAVSSLSKWQFPPNTF